MIRIAEREYGFADPPEGEPPEVTLRLLATMEYVKETLAELDAEAAMLPGGEENMTPAPSGSASSGPSGDAHLRRAADRPGGGQGGPGRRVRVAG
jgi:hypothetical protein